MKNAEERAAFHSENTHAPRDTIHPPGDRARHKRRPRAKTKDDGQRQDGRAVGGEGPRGSGGAGGAAARTRLHDSVGDEEPFSAAASDAETAILTTLNPMCEYSRA